MVFSSFVVEFAALSSETVVSMAFICIIAGYLTILKWNLPSLALTEGFKQCSMFTNQFIISKDSLSA